MKTLITGVAGFIGSALARRLLREGHEVLGIDSLSDYYDPAIKRANLASLEHARFQFSHVDLLNAPLSELLPDIDVVFHLAGQPGVRKSWGSDFSVYTASNVDATQRLLDAASRLTTPPRFVYASSSSVYGDAETYPTPESIAPSPLSPYGVTKLAGEHLCRLYAVQHGIHSVALRYFTVYGPGQRPDMAFTRFISAGIRGEQISVYGDGSQLRDFTFVEDVVTANVLAATGAVEPGSVFNVAGGSQASVSETLEIIERELERPLRIEHLPPAPGDVRRTGGSTVAISAGLGWKPTIDLQEGIRRQVEWGLQSFSA
ncbi:NAD-dependent epimerase/dehydratase family protein [Schumannella luteola]